MKRYTFGNGENPRFYQAEFIYFYLNSWSCTIRLQNVKNI